VNEWNLQKIINLLLFQLKRLVSLKDNRIKEKDRVIKQIKEDPTQLKVIEKPKSSSTLFFSYNTQLGPPYHVILDTNFINFSIKNKLDILKSMMDCLYAKCIPYITEYVYLFMFYTSFNLINT